MSSSAATDDVAGADRGASFCSAVDDALKNGKPDAVPDESLQRVLSAAVRLYAAKSEDRERELAPVGDRHVNATEGGTATRPNMRAADVDLRYLPSANPRG